MSFTGPFRNYPQITVYHPDEGNGHAFVNLGWTGWIGSISGKKGVGLIVMGLYLSSSTHLYHPTPSTHPYPSTHYYCIQECHLYRQPFLRSVCPSLMTLLARSHDLEHPSL